MIQAFLDEASTRAGERYVNFLTSLRAVLGASLSIRPDDSRAFEAIRSGAYEVARVFLQSEADQFETDLSGAQDRARRQLLSDLVVDDAETRTPVQSYHMELVDWFRQELRAQIERDVNVLIHKRRELVLAATISARSTRRDLMLTYLEKVREGNEKVSFYFTDRGGRRYPSQKFARQHYRRALLMYAVDSYSSEAATFGVDRLYIWHPEPGHSYNGEVITLVGEPDMLQFSDVWEDVFHPNSNAFVTAKGEKAQRV